MPNIEGGSSHEQQILDTIQEVEFPLMTALQKEFGAERGWRICGPASVALSRILSTRTGVPISRSLPGEHIELALGIFDPKTDPDRLSRMEEQTYIRYHVGDGHIYYIDPIYGLLMLEKQQLQEAIQVEKYHADTINAELIIRHNLHPFDANHDDIGAIGCWSHYKTPEEKYHDWEDSVTILNGKSGTYQYAIPDCGIHVSKSDMHRVVPIIQQLAPGFEEDLMDKLQHIRTVAEGRQAASDSRKRELSGFDLSPKIAPLLPDARLATLRPIHFKTEIDYRKIVPKEFKLENLEKYLGNFEKFLDKSPKINSIPEEPK